MIKNLLLFIGVLFISFSFAQIEQQGTPFGYLLQNQSEVFTVSLPNINETALRANDAIFDEDKSIPWRFGKSFDVNYTLENSGTFTTLNNGDRIWQLAIYSDGAQTLNFVFENFELQQGAKLFLYNEDLTHKIGAFTQSNNSESKVLATTLILGEKIIVELYEPTQTIGKNTLSITNITHGYRSLEYQFKGIGDSGGCNNNVICSVGDDWRDQIKSVGLMLVNNSSFCTGALINNTCEDAKPYFLTAAHCVSSYDGNEFNQINIQFNFESSECNTNSYQGPNQSVSGTTLRARNSGSDFALLELNTAPPAEFEVYYSGWDRSGNTPTSSVGIHHPAGDLKKISFDDNPATNGTFSGATTWRVGNWEDGTTEGGSSGSPLYNQDKRIVGQLYGGSASCQNITEDHYGKFDVSWDDGSGPTNELQSWLDGCGTSALVLDGYDPNSVTLNQDVALDFVNPATVDNCNNELQQVFRIRNRGLQTLTNVTFNYGLNLENSYTWTGVLEAGESDIITLSTLTLPDGSYTYSAEIISSNLSNDENPNNDGFSFQFTSVDAQEVVVEVQVNAFGSENSFNIVNSNGDVVATEGPFNDFTGQLYVFTYCLPADDYTFTINDTGGDGMGSVFGIDPNGGFDIFVNDVNVGSSDGDFDDQAIVDFTIISTNIKNIKTIELSIFPNPTSSSFTIQFEEESLNLSIYNSVGQLSLVTRNISSNQVIDISSLNSGIYFVKVQGENSAGLKKLIVK